MLSMHATQISVRIARSRLHGIVAATLLVVAPLGASAQHAGHDTTKRAAPAAKNPAVTTKASPAQTKTKSAGATKTKAPATKAPATKTTSPKAAPAPAARTRAVVPDARIPIRKEVAPRADSMASKRDSSAHAGHAAQRDTTAQKQDTAHKHPADSARALARDTTHVHTPDSTAHRDTAHAHMADTAQKRDTAHAHLADSSRMAMQDTMPMSMAGALGISMERMGSGTTWIPDAVTLPSRHYTVGKWMLMLHGFLFVQYDKQGGPRGASQFGSLNWAMIMADRELAGGRVQFRFMPSLDPATVGKCGYPLLLQSGEMCNGKPIVDRQHPHDLFMELGALYERPIGSNFALLLYAAPAGEPALGPVAFMHRPSAMDEPQAPLGHHWQDATHISFGVVTAGLFTRKLRLEASAFNGHEPNEERWDFDPISLNSYSGRLTVNPNDNWSLTAGYGKLDNPELSNPPESMRRFAASAMYGQKLGEDGQWATTAIYGRNQHAGEDPSHSGLLESEAVLGKHNTVFGRAEYVQKSAHDLQLAAFPDEQLFGVSSLSLGYIRDVKRGAALSFGIGARGTVNFVPRDLEASYGSRNPVGGMVFVRIRPFHSQPHASKGMGDMQHHGNGYE
jgi:hypothetical protein